MLERYVWQHSYWQRHTPGLSSFEKSLGSQIILASRGWVAGGTLTLCFKLDCPTTQQENTAIKTNAHETPIGDCDPGFP